jgi:transposase
VWNQHPSLAYPIRQGKSSERVGHRAAAIQSLLATAKLNGLEPLRWLTKILEKLLTCSIRQINSLVTFAKPGN